MIKLTDQPIVVPWDFSDLSKDALAKAIEMADSSEPIEVVHVTPYPATVDPSVVWGVYTEQGIREEINESFAKEFPEFKNDQIKFSTFFGDPGVEIARHAKEINAGLIVISSHGRTGIRRLLMGSVAERVVRLAPCPVLVLRQEYESTATT